MKWPHAILDLLPFEVFKTKLKAKINGSFPWPDIKLKLISPDSFDINARKYIDYQLALKIKILKRLQRIMHQSHITPKLVSYCLAA